MLIIDCPNLVFVVEHMIKYNSIKYILNIIYIYLIVQFSLVSYFTLNVISYV